MNGGLGSPTGFYYPPLTYWIASLLRFLSGTDPYAWRQLGVAAAVALVLSGLACYYWLRRIVNPRAAVIGSLAFLILPYHTEIDLYTRGALAELWTFVWMPLVLLAVDAILSRRRLAFVGLSLSYAALTLTHLPTTLIFSLVPVAYCLCFSKAGDRLRAFLVTTGAMALGIGLAAIYLFPAMAMQEFIFHTTEGISGHYYFGNWFLFTHLKWTGDRSDYFQVPISALFVAVLAFVMAGRSKATRLQAVFWFFIAVLCFFMMTQLSNPVWQALKTLQKIQFPFRFNTVLSLAVAALIALSFSQLKRQSKVSAAFVVITIVLAGIAIYAMARRTYYMYPSNYVNQSEINWVNRRFEQRRDTDEFRPRWVVAVEDKELAGLLNRIGQSGGALNKLKVIKGEGSATVEKWSAREIIFWTDCPTTITVNVSQFYFPGWFVRFDERSEASPALPSKPGGLIQIEVPAGHHRATLQLGKRVPELAGQITSGAALIFLLVLLLYSLRRSPRTTYFSKSLNNETK